MDLNTGFAFGGLIGLVATVAIMGWQTRRLTQQTVTANAIAMLAAHANALERLHALQTYLLDHPDLLPYFVDGKPCAVGDSDYARVRLLAEMHADIADLGLELHRRIPDPVHQDCWSTTLDAMLTQPVLSEVLRSGQPWWPDLNIAMAELPEDPEASTDRRDLLPEDPHSEAQSRT